MNHEYFMKKALDQAQTALNKKEFPVGCVIVHENKVIAAGIRKGSANSFAGETDHAEMVALRNLEALNFDINRNDVSLYCTMEPCLMCFGAILLSNIGTIVYAYEDVMGGAARCKRNLLAPLYRREIAIIPNIMRIQSLNLFKSFFSDPENKYWKGSLLADYTLKQ
ncbi:CMP/dCMP deaminase zinc-binding domain-containing protein [Desulfonema limicola]|uniref:CMP/dCMP deaminase zinc-binding domain-containing protein n=1 Tax=Desulfonema limicola TaxID=45656 RepID=A0A975GJH6_9BACT|nr:nucleoside deaminase [Desulfonema limicola]QTA83475.1 CMP/dCMP deaminase zinc-binding domain-containing protein [Desulfonema limicola]